MFNDALMLVAAHAIFYFKNANSFALI